MPGEVEPSIRITFSRLWRHLLVFWLAIVCELTSMGSPGLASENDPSYSVILISVDTLRADYLSCYGNRLRRTPHLDAMADGGTLFSAVSAQVPLTLPSHVSLLTSTYPFSNGVEDNGEQLGPHAITLARVLKSRGYHTAAFVGGFVLDRRFGLNQGFDVYDSPFDVHREWGAHPEDIKRLGEGVVYAATEWLTENSRRPFFVFLHLYDLHVPYNLPPSVRARFGGTGYEAELGYVDEVLGRFWEFLSQRGLLQKTLVVFTSDHGEGLGEHGETTHGYFIYQSTCWVPLIIHWPVGARRFPAKVDEPRGLIDVTPTILQFLGISRPPQFQGRSLLALMDPKSGKAPQEIYSESSYAHDYFGLSSLHSLRLGRYKYIEAPRPELYDLVHDSPEVHNLYTSEKSLALTLRERLVSLRSRFRGEHTSVPKALDPEVVALLSSLGYLHNAVSSAHSDSLESGPDPKDYISNYEEYCRALLLASSDRLRDSNALLEQLLAKDPRLLAVRLSLGMNAQRLGQHEKAVDRFRQVLKQDPLNVGGHFNLGVSYLKLRQPDDAIKEFQAVLALAPHYTRADELLGTIWLQRNDYQKARAHFRHILTVAPDSFAAHYNLGKIEMEEGRNAQAAYHLNLALKADPGDAGAHNALGSLYLLHGDLDQAREEFTKAISLDMKFAPAHYNLGVILRQQKRNDEAASEFRAALAADPQFRAARDALQVLQRLQY